MKDVTNNATNNFLETIEPVYTPGTINFDFDKFDAAIQAAVSELSDEQLDQLEYDEVLKEITRFKGLGDKLDDKRKEIGRIYKDSLTEFESKLATSLEPLNALLDKLRAKRDEVKEHKKCCESTTLDQSLKVSVS